MDKKNIQIIATGVLSLVLVILVFGGIFGKKSKRQHVSIMPSDSLAQTFSDFDNNVAYLASKEINDSLERLMQEKLQDGWQRNPFHILVSTQGEEGMMKEEIVSMGEPTFEVNGIVFAQNGIDSQVIVNGELRSVGDTIDDWTVTSIEDDTVLFKNGEREYIFNLYLMQE